MKEEETTSRRGDRRRVQLPSLVRPLTSNKLKLHVYSEGRLLIEVVIVASTDVRPRC